MLLTSQKKIKPGRQIRFCYNFSLKSLALLSCMLAMRLMFLHIRKNRASKLHAWDLRFNQVAYRIREKEYIFIHQNIQNLTLQKLYGIYIQTFRWNF